jgi:predicted nucleic acid-binding protein
VYVADAVAMNRRLVDRLPERVDRIFDRAEDGLDRIETTPAQMAEVAWSAKTNEVVAGVGLAADPRRAVRLLPVECPQLGTGAYLRLGRLFDLYSMHDALLVAAHKSRDTDGILTVDSDVEEFDGEAVVWD